MGLKRGYDELRTLLALPDAAERKNLRKAMQFEGVLHCREVAEMRALQEKITQSEPDLLIITLTEGGWDTLDLIRKVRHGLLGGNPFMVIIVLLEEASAETVKQVVSAGADDLLLQPGQARQIIARLDNFAQGRKPFLVTHDYIGPERRKVKRANSAPTFEVPNPVQWWKTGGGDRSIFREKVDGALGSVNLRKIKSTGGQLRFLADRAVAHFAQDGHEATLPTLRSLLEASDELARRAANTDFAPAIELSASLQILCQRLLREKRVPRSDEIAVLPSLADAVVIAIHRNDRDPSFQTKERRG